MKRRTVRLDKVQTVVLDEADRMLDMGFVRDVTRILDQLKHRRNLGMFSATISRGGHGHLLGVPAGPGGDHRPPGGGVKPDITQYRIDLDGREQKLDTIAAPHHPRGVRRAGHRLLQHQEHDRPAGRPAEDAESPARPSTATFSSASSGRRPWRSSSGRDQGAGGHRRGRPGPDIDDVDAVFNYDVPDELENYTTASAAPAGPSATVWPTPSSPPSPRGIRMDDIVRNTKAECSGSDTTPTAASCWWRTANNFHGF